MGETAGFFFKLATAVKQNGCDLPGLAQILEDTATKVGASSVANVIGRVEQVAVEGADVTLDLNQLVADAGAKYWQAVGNDFGSLASWITSTGCKTYVCKLVEGLLDGLKIPLENVQRCEADLKGAEGYFVTGANSFSHKQYEDALKNWAAGLNQVMKGLQDCGVTAELSYLQQEAHVLGFSKVKILGEAASFLVHGSNVYEDIFSTYQSF